MDPTKLFSYVPSYDTIDNSLKEAVNLNYSTYYGITQDPITSVLVDDVIRPDLDTRMFPGHTKDQLAGIEQMFANVKHNYVKETSDIAMINNLSNAGQYVTTTIEKESSRLSGLRDRTFANVHKMRQMHLAKAYDVRYNQFVSGVMQFTTFTLVVCVMIFMLLMTDKMAAWIGYGIIGLIGFIYLIVLLLSLKQKNIRNKYDWDKYNFGSMKKE